MSILKLQLGTPYEIALKYRTAKESTGLSGKQFLYTLASPANHVMYVSPGANDEIQSLKAEPGELFTLLKTIGPNGAHQYAVERIPGMPAPEPIIHKPMAAAVTITPSPGVPIPPSLTTAESKRIFTQLVATIQGCQAAEAFAESIGYPMKFDSQDIRAMTISGFIEQSRRAA